MILIDYFAWPSAGYFARPSAGYFARPSAGSSAFIRGKARGQGTGVVGGKARTSFQKSCPSGKFFEMIFNKKSEIPEGGSAPPTRTFQKSIWRRRSSTRRNHGRPSPDVRTSRLPAVALSPKAWKRGNHVSHT